MTAGAACNGGYDRDRLDAGGWAAAGVWNARGSNTGLPSARLVYIATADLQGFLARALELGGEVLRAPTRDSPFAVVRDPGGAAFTLVDQASPW